MPLKKILSKKDEKAIKENLEEVIKMEYAPFLKQNKYTNVFLNMHPNKKTKYLFNMPKGIRRLFTVKTAMGVFLYVHFFYMHLIFKRYFY